MTIAPVTNMGIQALLTSTLQQQQSQLTELTQELSTQQQHSDLTDYDPSDARAILNLQSGATQKQAYLSVINTVSSKLSVYNTTLTDLETIASQAQSLSNDNPNYSAATASNIAIEATNYLTSVGVDLNQQLDGQYIYSGTRYGTAPVGNLATLPTSTLSPTVYTDGASLPSYDATYTTPSLTESVSGQTVTVGGTVSTPESASITVNNKTYSYQVTASDTTATIASSLASLVAADIPGTTATGSAVTVGGTGTINAATPTNTSVAAYTTDQATVDTGYTINYGLSSNNPAMQQLVAGLRYLQKAGNDTDSATYASDMQQASTLLTTAMSGLQGVNTTVAYNINTMSTEKAAQNTAISQLTDQLSNIQSVDVTQVSAEITSMQTILQASYMVTGDIEKMSIVSYL